MRPLFTTLHDAASATATGNPLEIGVMSGRYNTAVFQITGTFTASVAWQATVGQDPDQADNTWVAIPARNVATGAVATTATAAGVYRANVAGYNYVRANLTWTSGTSITVIGQVVEAAVDDALLTSGTLGTVNIAANDGVDIGSVDVLSIAAGSNSIGGTKDNGPHWTTVYGVSGARFTSADASGADAAVTDAPTSGQKLCLTDVTISVDTAMRVDLKLETAGTVLHSFYLPANGTVQFTPRAKFKLATADKKLMVRTSAAGNIAVTAYYYSEA